MSEEIDVSEVTEAIERLRADYRKPLTKEGKATRQACGPHMLPRARLLEGDYCCQKRETPKYS